MVVGLHTLLCEVTDMDRAITFYRDLLDFQVHYTSPHWSTLQIGTTRVGLHPAFDGKGEVKGGGWVFMLEASDIRGLRARLEGAGVKCSPYHDTPGGAIFNFSDPDGNRLQAIQSGVMQKDLKPLAPETFEVPNEAAMRELGSSLAVRFKAGDVVFLSGDLGAGKTTLVRGILGGLGWDQEVRSPTFNLLHTYPNLTPLVVHADLYRVASWQGIGIEDYLDSHLCLIEWPDRAAGLVGEGQAWRIEIEFAGDARLVKLLEPKLL